MISTIIDVYWILRFDSCIVCVIVFTFTTLNIFAKPFPMAQADQIFAGVGDAGDDVRFGEMGWSRCSADFVSQLRGIKQTHFRTALSTLTEQWEKKSNSVLWWEVLMLKQRTGMTLPHLSELLPSKTIQDKLKISRCVSPSVLDASWSRSDVTRVCSAALGLAEGGGIMQSRTSAVAKNRHFTDWYRDAENSEPRRICLQWMIQCSPEPVVFCMSFVAAMTCGEHWLRLCLRRSGKQRSDGFGHLFRLANCQGPSFPATGYSHSSSSKTARPHVWRPWEKHGGWKLVKHRGDILWSFMVVQRYILLIRFQWLQIWDTTKKSALGTWCKWNQHNLQKWRRPSVTKAKCLMK